MVMLWRLTRITVPVVFKQNPFKFHQISTRNLILSYKIISDTPTDPDTPPILIFHGLLWTKKLWEGLGKTIGNLTKRTVVVVDVRNHGDSPHTNSHKYEELAQDILDLYEKLAIHEATLIGHSMGGKACMCAALLSPLAVASLLIVEASPGFTSPHCTTTLRIMEAMKAFSFKDVKQLSKARRAAKKALRGLIDDETTMTAVISNIVKRTNEGIGFQVNLDTLIKEFPHIAQFPVSMKNKHYFGPTLFIGGQLSEHIPADHLPVIREFYPSAVVKYVNKAGHNLHIEDSKRFLELAITFLKIPKNRDNE